MKGNWQGDPSPGPPTVVHDDAVSDADGDDCEESPNITLSSAAVTDVAIVTIVIMIESGTIVVCFVSDYATTTITIYSQMNSHFVTDGTFMTLYKKLFIRVSQRVVLCIYQFVFAVVNCSSEWSWIKLDFSQLCQLDASVMKNLVELEIWPDMLNLISGS